MVNRTNYIHFLADRKYHARISLLLHLGGLVLFFFGSKGSISSHSRSVTSLEYAISLDILFYKDTKWVLYDAVSGKTTEALANGREIHWVVSPQEEPDVYVSGKIRRLENRDWIISLFLVNAQQEPNRGRDKAWLFQPELIVSSPDSSNPDIFLRKPIPVSIKNLDPLIHQENQAMGMLYRHQV